MSEITNAQQVVGVDAQTAIESVKAVELPKTFSEADQLRVLCSNEKLERLDVQIRMLQVQLQMSQKDQDEARKEREGMLKRLWAQYRMSETDSVDIKTGVITRNIPSVASSAVN